MRKRLTVAAATILALLASVFVFAQPANAATGFYVDNGRLYEAGGQEFVIRGVSHPHAWYAQETDSFAGIKSHGANTVRVVLSNGVRWTKNDAADVANVISLCKQNRLICMLEVHDTTGYGEQSGASTLDQAVDYWIEIQSALEGQEDYVLINIGNEPYGNDSATVADWASDTSAAIQRMRDAGFDHTLVVDAPNWGQDWSHTMRDNAGSVYTSDPTGNTVFSIHMYGVYEQGSTVTSYLEHFVNAGLPIMIGEFGHDHSDGNPDEDTIMAEAERLGLGYIGWSWSGNGGGVEYLDMVNNFDADSLTSWGQRIFYGANGISSTAEEATVYGGEPPTDPTDPPTDPTDPPTDPPAEGDCSADYTTVGSWGGGFQGEVTVTAGDSAISNWTVSWTFPGGQSVSHGWNASFGGGSPVTASNAPYNGQLGAGQSTTFGFIGSGSAPGSLTLTCTTD
ncbi:cellulase family glycosylhydrolase [Thermobifida halotolerans]|nr:cellulase family glycosylhydrolase [Thermobifida halotolerans]UOE20020.1 cellulase family glycosylhydrolase [Thermobifida halotolerans]